MLVTVLNLGRVLLPLMVIYMAIGSEVLSHELTVDELDVISQLPVCLSLRIPRVRVPVGRNDLPSFHCIL